MALFNTLKQILTPYANKINLHSEEIEEIQSDVSDLDDDVSDLKSVINSTVGNTELTLQAIWEFGSINTQTGDDVSNNARIRTKGFIDISNCDSVKFAITSGYKYWWYLYDASGNLLRQRQAWATSDTLIDAAKIGAAVQMRIVMANASDTSASVDYAQYLRLSSISKLRAAIDTAAETVTTIGHSLRNFTDKITNVDHLIEQGFWSFGQGVAGTSTTYVRTINSVNGFVSVTIPQEYGIVLGLLAYNGDTYIGAWNTTNQEWEINPYKHDFDSYSFNIEEFIEKFPAYTFRMTIRYYDGSTTITPSILNNKIVFEKYFDFSNIANAVNTVSVIPEIRNGSDNNTANAYMVALNKIVPYKNSSAIKIIVNKPLSNENNKYKIRFDTYTVNDGFTKDNVNNRVTLDKQIEGNETYIRKGLFDNTSVGFAFSINEVDANGTNVVLRVTDFKADDVKIIFDYSDTTLNPELEPNLIQAKRPINPSANAYLSETQPVVLLHFSDIHGNANELKRMVGLRSQYSSMIDDIICTGDMVVNRYVDGMSYWNSVPGASKILLAIGNHDALADTTGYDFTNLATQSEQFSQFFNPYIENWGCTYENNKTYYYKDYSAKEVRLVVLNCMLSGDDETAQQTWFTNVLSTAKTSGLSVIIATHYMPSNPQKVSCNFTTLDMDVGTDLLNNFYATAIDNFKSNGGEFICYIAGHKHCDMIIKHALYPNQFCICVDALNPNSSNIYSDTQRTQGTRSQDLANLITLDTTSKVFKIIRYGANTDHYLRKKNCLTINYLTGEIIAES